MLCVCSYFSLRSNVCINNKIQMYTYLAIRGGGPGRNIVFRRFPFEKPLKLTSFYLKTIRD